MPHDSLPFCRAGPSHPAVTFPSIGFVDCRTPKMMAAMHPASTNDQVILAHGLRPRTKEAARPLFRQRSRTVHMKAAGRAGRAGYSHNWKVQCVRVGSVSRAWALF